MPRSAAPVALPFLMSMVALPACGPAVGDDGDPRVPDGGEPEKFEESCRASYDRLFHCYQEEYADEYGDEYGEDYDVDGYVGELCESAKTETQQDYGTGCVGAFEEVFACLASLDCDVLVGDWEGVLPEDCAEVARDANERCPEAFPSCSGGGSGFGDGACDRSTGECLDGHEYNVSCAEDGPALSCSCSVDGEETETLSVAGSCSAAPWAELEEACGFPDISG